MDAGTGRRRGCRFTCQIRDSHESAIICDRFPSRMLRCGWLMRFVDGMTMSEIGSALGIPEGTVKSRLHNALAALKADPGIREYFEGT